MKVPIIEIFKSLHGEGPRVGRPAIFIRFAGCNKTCEFCDTAHFDGTLMSVEEIGTKVNSYLKEDSADIVFTGGEPLLRAEEIYNIILYIGRYCGVIDKFTLETNGSIPIPARLFDLFDCIVISPKDLQAFFIQQKQSRWQDPKVYAKLLMPDMGEHFARAMQKIYFSNPVYFQPVYKFCDDLDSYLKTCRELADFVKDFSTYEVSVILSIQIHKLLGLR